MLILIALVTSLIAGIVVGPILLVVPGIDVMLLPRLVVAASFWRTPAPCGAGSQRL